MKPLQPQSLKESKYFLDLCEWLHQQKPAASETAQDSGS